MQLATSSRMVPHAPLSLPLVNTSQNSEHSKSKDSALRLLRPIVAPVKTIPCLRQGKESINAIRQNRQLSSVPERSWAGFISEKVAPMVGVKNALRDVLIHDVQKTMASIDAAFTKIEKNEAFLLALENAIGEHSLASTFALDPQYHTLKAGLASKRERFDRLQKECVSLQALSSLYQDSLKSAFADVTTLKHRHQNVAQKLAQLHAYLASLESDVVDSDAPDVFYLLASFAHQPQAEASHRAMAETTLSALTADGDHAENSLGSSALTGLKQHYLHQKIGHLTESAYIVQKDLRSMEESMPLHPSEYMELSRIKDFFNHETLQNINQTLDAKEGLDTAGLSKLLDSLLDVEQVVARGEDLIAQIEQSPRPVSVTPSNSSFPLPVDVVEETDGESVCSDLSLDSSFDVVQQRSTNPLQFLWRCFQLFNPLRCMGYHGTSQFSASQNEQAPSVRGSHSVQSSEVENAVSEVVGSAVSEAESHAASVENLQSLTTLARIKESHIQNTMEELEDRLFENQSLGFKVSQGVTDARLRAHFGHSYAFERLRDDATELHQLSTAYAQLMTPLKAEKIRISALPLDQQLVPLDRLNRLLTDLSDQSMLLHEQLKGSFMPLLLSAWQSFSQVDAYAAREEMKTLFLSVDHDELLSPVRRQTFSASIDFLKSYHAYTKTLLARQQPITETERQQLTDIESHLAQHLDAIETLQYQIDDPIFVGKEGYDRFENEKENLFAQVRGTLALADDVIWQVIQRLPTEQEVAQFQYADRTPQKVAMPGAASEMQASTEATGSVISEESAIVASAQEVAAAKKIQQAWRAYQESPQQVTLSLRPLSRGTLKKKLRNFITEGKPIHTAVIASKGRGQPVNHIFTAQETAGRQLSVSHPGSDVATRDKQAWLDTQAPVLTKVLPLPVSTFTHLSKQIKDRDSALGVNNMRSAYVELKSIINHWTAGALLNIPILNTLVALPNSCQSHVSHGLNEMAGMTNLKYEYLIQNGLVQPDRFKPVTQEALALPNEAYLLGWSFGQEKPV